MKSLIVAALLPASLAVANPRQIEATKPNLNDLVFGRAPVAPTGVTALAQTRVFYLNKNGVTLNPGNDDSRANTSSIIAQRSTIPAWNVDAATWAATKSCLVDMFSHYAITITDQDPGQTPHIEAVFGGTAANLGFTENYGGVSPFTTDCSIIENSVVFTFTGAFAADAQTACEIMAQEIAHSYGLDHELLASDPMTYLDYQGKRTFKDQMVSCGEDVTRPCGLQGYTCSAQQNSVKMLEQRIGINGGNNGGDTTPPVVGITSPANRATVRPGFQVRATASDNVGVASAQLYIDGSPEGAPLTGGGPFVFTTPSSLPEGIHDIKIEVSDGANVQEQTIEVTVDNNATNPPNNGGGTDPTTDGSADIVGGCSTGGATGFGGLLLALGLLIRRRR